MKILNAHSGVVRLYVSACWIWLPRLQAEGPALFFHFVSPSVFFAATASPCAAWGWMAGWGRAWGGGARGGSFALVFLSPSTTSQPTSWPAGRGRGAVMRVLSPSVIRIWWHDTIPVWTGIIRRHFLCVTGPPSPLRPGSRFGVRCSSKKAGLRGLVRLDRGVVWTLENGRKLKKRIYVLISK